VKRTLGRETLRQYTTTRLEYEQKQKEQTTPSPSELKRKETQEFAQDVGAIVSTAEVELPSVPQPTIAKDPFSQAAVLTGAPVPEERKYTRYKRVSDVILEKAAEIHEQQTKPGLPHIMSFGGKVKTAPMYEATAGAVSAVEDVSPRFKPPTRQPIYPGSYFLGKAASSLAVGYVLSKTMVEPYVEEAARAWRGSRAEMWLIRHSRWYRQRAARTITPGILSPPKHPVMRVPKVSEDIWEWGTVPRTSLLWTEKVLVKQTKFVPKFFVRGTAMVPMATKVTESAYKPMPESWAKGFRKPRFREDPVAWFYGIQKAPAQIGIQVSKTSLQKIPYLPMFETARTPALPSRLFGSEPSLHQLKKAKPIRNLKLTKKLKHSKRPKRSRKPQPKHLTSISRLRLNLNCRPNSDARKSVNGKLWRQVSGGCVWSGLSLARKKF